MDAPETVQTALEDRPVAGATCLEAGAGVGNATAGLLAAGAGRVYAVTDRREHARTVRERVEAVEPGASVAALEGDVRSLPLPDDAVEVITAHALCNVLPPAAMGPAAEELSRVAAPGCHLVVDDYAPLSADAPVRALFAVENAAHELAHGRPALTFYPAGALRALFAGHGWVHDRTRTLLDPVPWTRSHVEAHADAAREAAAALPDAVGAPLAAEADRLRESVGATAAGTMYSAAFRLRD